VTAAPVLERHRRAGALAHSLNGLVPDYAEGWVSSGKWPPDTCLLEAEATAQVAANAERDGKITGLREGYTLVVAEFIGADENNPETFPDAVAEPIGDACMAVNARVCELQAGKP